MILSMLRKRYWSIVDLVLLRMRRRTFFLLALERGEKEEMISSLPNMSIPEPMADDGFSYLQVSISTATT